MILRFLASSILVWFFAALGGQSFAEETASMSIRYLPLDAPPGMSQAVIVQGAPLVYTRQLLPLDSDGKITGDGSISQQIDQVLKNLRLALNISGSGMEKLVRVNVYALSTSVVDKFREHLSKRVGPSVRPAISAVLTPLADRTALIAVDAVAAASEPGIRETFDRCPALSGHEWCDDTRILPRSGIAYLSGQPDEGAVAETAVAKSMSDLMKTMGHLKITPKDVVQMKVFLRPASSAEEVLGELRKFFPGQPLPPVVFVEWLASVPVEIEMIARLPPSDMPGEDIVYYTPPEVRPSNTFSKAVLLRGDRQIFISGLYAKVPSRGEPQAVYVFDQLQDVLKKSGSDMRHLVKGTYYVSDDDAARWVDRLRPRVFDPLRPPAASKIMVHGVGMPQRTMTVDMIAVPTGK
jgi:enamine deaminase RidA (YjgF/YER057c/UK114 family)